MSDKLDQVHEQFPRKDQENKRKIAEYLYNRPGQWVPRQELVEQFDIDGSGITRHINALHDEQFLLSTGDDDQRKVKWNGRGAGGVEYWLRQMIPKQLWVAGSELRPLLTLDSLGGAYVPTLLFGILVLIGFLTGIFAIVVSYFPSDSALGVTATDAVFLSGMITVMASLIFLLIPISKLLDHGIEVLWVWTVEQTEKGGDDE